MDHVIDRPPPAAGAPPGREAARPAPFAPLSAAEIRRVVAVVRGDGACGADVPLETIEPQDRDAPRGARANLFRDAEDGVWQVAVSLDDGRILSRRFVAPARPTIQLERFITIEAAVRADPRFVAACAARGITDMGLVCVDPWSAGSAGPPAEDGLHVAHTFCWPRTRDNDDLYAHPIEGLNAVVDLKAGTVLRVDDYGIVPVPMGEANSECQFRDAFRPALKPLDVVRPQGASFTLDGHSIA